VVQETNFLGDFFRLTVIYSKKGL